MIKHLACLAVLCLFPVLLSAAGPETAPAPISTDGHFPTFGLALDNPDGWLRVGEESPENIARWAVMDLKTGQPEAILAVYVGRSGDGLIAYAQNQVRATGGAITGEVQVDGERGILITGGGTASIITKHAGLFYIVGLRQGAGHHEKDFSNLANSIRWGDIESPVRHMDLGNPISALGGSITIQAPACMRPCSADTTATMLHLVATDIANRREFTAMLQSASVNNNATLADVRKTLLDGWNQKLQPKQPFVWKIDPDHPERAVTNLVQVDMVSNDQRGKMGLLFGLVADGKKAVLLSFSIKDAPDDELDSYEAAAQSIMLSVKFNKPQK